MKKILFASILSCVTLCGCGHNVVTYSDGVGMETTFRPDSGNFGLTFRYGKILNATVRENTEIEMAGQGQSSGNQSADVSGGASGTVKIKIGNQITGYYVDALKAGASKQEIENHLKKENVK